MFTLLFIMMLIAATAAWFIIQRLQERPWTEYGVIAGSQDEGGPASSAPNIGLWSFLAVVASIFMVFTASYFMRMNSAHGGVSSGVMNAWMPISEPPLLWINTLVLVVTSLFLELARRSAAAMNSVNTRRSLFLATILTLTFLSLQVVAWRMVAPEAMSVSNAAFTFFVLLTAVHGVHLLGGLFVLTRAVARLQQPIAASDKPAYAALQQTVRLCATYWHFLLLVWVGLFALLLST